MILDPCTPVRCAIYYGILMDKKSRDNTLTKQCACYSQIALTATMLAATAAMPPVTSVLPDTEIVSIHSFGNKFLFSVSKPRSIG